MGVNRDAGNGMPDLDPRPDEMEVTVDGQDVDKMTVEQWWALKHWMDGDRNGRRSMGEVSDGEEMQVMRSANLIRLLDGLGRAL